MRRRFAPRVWREIPARFDSIGACGHPLRRGESIGYNGKEAICLECLTARRYEERATRAYEETGSDCSYDW